MYAARRISNEHLGVSKSNNLSAEERVSILSDKVSIIKNNEGFSVTDMLYNLIYGGPTELIPERLFDILNGSKYKIPFIAESTMGEIIGWAIPDTMPPRNGRTSKALYALGYSVRLFS
jgi:hypothetical protein